MTNTANLSIDFEFNSINDKSMSTDIYINNELVGSYRDITATTVNFNHNIILPATLKIVFADKDEKNDTIVDVDGNITIDKHVRIKNICLGYIPINNHILSKICNFTTPTGNNIHNMYGYFGFNGTAIIEFLATNSITWHLTHHNLFNHV